MECNSEQQISNELCTMNNDKLLQRLNSVEGVLKELLLIVKELTAEVKKTELVSSNEILSYSVDILDLPPRVKRAFEYYKIKTLGDLLKIPRRRLLMMYGVGVKALKDIERELGIYGHKVEI